MTTVRQFVPYSGRVFWRAFVPSKDNDKRRDLHEKWSCSALTPNRVGVDFDDFWTGQEKARSTLTGEAFRTTGPTAFRAATQRRALQPRAATNALQVREVFEPESSAVAHDCQSPHYRHERGGAST
jgi:hypothetical protein